jgi:hypothetical protein
MEYLGNTIGGKKNSKKPLRDKGSFVSPTFIKAGEKLQEHPRLILFQPGFLSGSYKDEASLGGKEKLQWNSGTVGTL